MSKPMIPEQVAGLAFSQATYTYKTVSDCNIQADVYRPVDGVSRPAILWIHGGALIMGSRSQLPPDQRQRYVQAGYVVVSIDYRLAPETKLPAILDDLHDAYRWVRTQGPDRFQIDPDRIGLIGHSAGGYLTLMAGFCLQPRPRALVSFYGYGDIVGTWYSRPDPFYCQQPAVSQAEAYQVVGNAAISESLAGERGRFYLYCRQRGLWPNTVAGYNPYQEPDAFAPFCPIHNVTKDYPPTLLLHGDQDTDVPCEQSILMAKELERQGVTHELRILSGQGHGFDRAGKAIQDTEVNRAFNYVLAFLEKHLT